MRYVSPRMDARAPAAAQARESLPVLLFYGIVPFRSLKQRPQWMAEGLAERRRVLYVDPHRSLLHCRRGRPALERVHDTLAVLTPPAVLPFSGFVRAINRRNAASTRVQVAEALAHLGWSAPSSVLATFPKHADATEGAPALVYDVMDDYPRFFGWWQRRVLARMHRELLARADAVVTSSHELAARSRHLGARRVEVVENGVPAWFREASARATPDPTLAAFPGPRFGYVGTISSWFDFSAVRRLALAFPSASVLLVGPRACRPPRLPPNVHFVDARPHEQLPSVLRAFDVGLVPFRRTALVDAVNPVKVYEYLAAGLPVLATDSTELRRFGAAVTVVDSEAWANGAAAVLATPPASRPLESEATWDRRVAAVEAILAAVEEAGAAAPGAATSAGTRP